MITANISIYYVLWICFIVTTPCMLGGITMGFSSIALSELNLSLNAGSWFSCLFTVAAPFGCVMTGYIIDKYGRKLSLIMCLVPAVAGWFLIWKNNGNIPRLFLGRFLTGLSCGATFFPAQVYLVEYIDLNPSLIRWRTSFANIIPTTTYFGYLSLFLMAMGFSYDIVALISFILATCALFYLIVFLPESPAWLFEKGRYGDAEWAQKRLKLPYSMENYPSISTVREADNSILNKIMRRDVYIPVMITSTTWALIMLTGTSVFSTYLTNLVDKNESYSEQTTLYLCSIFALLPFVSNIIQIFLVNITGVRKLMICTSSGLAFLTLCYGIISNFAADETSFTDFYQNLSIGVMWLIAFLQGLGFMTIPRAILGELFPVDAKRFAVVPTIVMYVVQGIVIKAHPYLAIRFGGFIFTIYATFTVFLAVFLHYFLPETVGKTMKQINEEFHKKEIPL